MRDRGPARAWLAVAVSVVAAIAIVSVWLFWRRQSAYRPRHQYRGASLVAYTRDARDRALGVDSDGWMTLTDVDPASGKVISHERRHVAPERAVSVIDRGFVERHSQRGVISHDRAPPRSVGPTVGLKVLVPEIQTLSFAWYSSSAVPASMQELLNEVDRLWEDGAVKREDSPPR